jgi:hypothetical protein
LLATIPELAQQDVHALVQAVNPQTVTATITQPFVMTIQLQIDPKQLTVTIEGQWWYRGVTAVEPADRGSLVVSRVYNIAPRASRWLVRFVHHHEEVAFRMNHAQLIKAIGRRLGCNADLVADSG